MFEHEEGLFFPELTAEMTDKGRFYSTPEGRKYPSVTTILGHGSDQTWLQAWKDRVGEEEVKRISGQASRRGTAVHEITEQYLRNNPAYAVGHMPGNIASFRYIKPYLDRHIKKVYGLEVPLYSDKLRAAGRVDCFAAWDDELSIVDFKTSKKEKSREDIHNYFLQCAMYSYMVFERTGLLPRKIVIVMTVDNSEPLIFEEKSRDWIEPAIKLRNSVDL